MGLKLRSRPSPNMNEGMCTMLCDRIVILRRYNNKATPSQTKSAGRSPLVLRFFSSPVYGRRSPRPGCLAGVRSFRSTTST